MPNHILHSHPRNQASLDLCSYLVTQVYYDYSPVCKAAANEWEQAAKDLSQWARLGRIEWNQQYLLSNLRSFMGMAIRPDDLPVVFGFPTKCHSMACAVRCTCYPPIPAIPKPLLSPNACCPQIHACTVMIQEARVYCNVVLMLDVTNKPRKAYVHQLLLHQETLGNLLHTRPCKLIMHPLLLSLVSLCQLLHRAMHHIVPCIY